MDQLNKVATVLKNGGVVICPTDTVYGFLADASSKKAVEKIYNIKKRPKSKPLSVFVKDFAMAQSLAHIDELQEKYIKKLWPGKYTFILKRKPSNPSARLRAGKLYGVDKKTVALRIPKYAFLNNLLKKVNRPLMQTSANISGKPSLNTINDIIKQFGGSDILIIDGGNLKKSKPSKIFDISNNNINVLRP